MKRKFKKKKYRKKKNEEINLKELANKNEGKHNNEDILCDCVDIFVFFHSTMS